MSQVAPSATALVVLAFDEVLAAVLDATVEEALVVAAVVEGALVVVAASTTGGAVLGLAVEVPDTPQVVQLVN